MDLDRLYLPHWQFSEHHQRLIDAPAAAVLDAVEDLLRFDDPLVRAFLVLREAPGRLAGLLGRRNDLAGRPRFGLHEFTRLERRADQAQGEGRGGPGGGGGGGPGRPAGRGGFRGGRPRGGPAGGR
ncbi:hypothetical protein OD781_25210, partial [Pseudomonas aeruginosa]|nr:hypothetical protein [Pseudomonas aeruginosa]